MVDLARKVVGVGSVGTRAWVILMLGRDGADPLFLQAKEAQASRVIEPFAGKSEFSNHGQRVVDGHGSRRSAATSSSAGSTWSASTASQRDFYLRQLWDWKGSSADLETEAPRARPCTASYADGPSPGARPLGRRVAIALPRQSTCSTGRSPRLPERTPTERTRLRSSEGSGRLGRGQGRSGLSRR